MNENRTKEIITRSRSNQLKTKKVRWYSQYQRTGQPTRSRSDHNYIIHDRLQKVNRSVKNVVYNGYCFRNKRKETFVKLHRAACKMQPLRKQRFGCLYSRLLSFAGSESVLRKVRSSHTKKVVFVFCSYSGAAMAQSD